MAARGRGLSLPPADSVVLEMGCSAAEFERLLPAAMRDWSVRGGPAEWVVDANGATLAVVSLRERPPRCVGRLNIPVAEVSIRFTTRDATLVEAFMTRFERGFHRGGG